MNHTTDALMERAKLELSDLCGKLDRMTAFMTNLNFAKIEGYDAVLLRRQYAAMQEYERTLRERLTRAGAL